MLSERKLQIMVMAVRIRVKIGEELEDILGSYAGLTEEDKEAIRKKVKNG